MSDHPPPSDTLLQAILDQLKSLEQRLERLESKAEPAKTVIAPAPSTPTLAHGLTQPTAPVAASPAPTVLPAAAAAPPTPVVPPPPRAPGPKSAHALPAELRGVQPHAPATTFSPAEPQPVSPSPAATPIVQSPSASTTKVEAVNSLSGSAPRPEPTAPPIAPPTAPPIASAAAPTSRPAAAAAAKKPFNLEWIIGTKGLAAAGALAVVIGVIFFLKYAVEQGWIGHLPPLVRCLFGVGFGGLLVAAGEVVRRKVNALGGAGLYAAGIACAYASVYAGYGYFSPPVIGQTTAFVALVLISALGITLSAGTRLASVAIVSLVGAYLAPFLLQSSNPNPLVFPVYAGALLATGLVLAAWLRGPFRWVGRSVWWATMILGGAWAGFNIDAHPVLVIGFVLCVWGMIHAAHIVAARGSFTSGDAQGTPRSTGSTLRNSGPMLSSFSVTGWATILMTLALRQINPAIDWIGACGVTAATGTLAVVLAGHLSVVKNRPRTDAERLGASLALQSASALIGTVALATSSAGPAAALLWLCMGLGAIFAGRWAGALAAVIYGTVLMVIGTGRLVLWDSWHSSLFSPTVDALGLALSPWAAWAALASVTWLVAAWVVSMGTPVGKRSIWGALNAAVGVLLLVAALIHPESDPHATTWAVLILCVVLLSVHRLRRQLALHVHTLVLLAVTTVKIGLTDVLTGSIPTGAPRLLGLPLTPSLWLCIGAAGAWTALALAARAMIGKHPQALRRAVACSMIALVMLLLAPVTQDLEHSHLVWPWALVAVALSPVSRYEPRLSLQVGAAIAACMSATAWAVVWVISPGFVHWSTTYPALLHPGLLSAVGVVAALIAVAKVGRSAANGKGSAIEEPLKLVCFVAAGAMFWLSTSFEASRIAEMVTGSIPARGPAVSIWWGLLAVALLYAGFRRAFPGLRYTGLALLGIAGTKVVLLDMADAPQLARVAGFVTLGLLMLGTAVGYARVAKALDAARPRPEAAGGEGGPTPPAM